MKVQITSCQALLESLKELDFRLPNPTSSLTSTLARPIKPTIIKVWTSQYPPSTSRSRSNNASSMLCRLWVEVQKTSVSLHYSLTLLNFRRMPSLPHLWVKLKSPYHLNSRLLRRLTRCIARLVAVKLGWNLALKVNLAAQTLLIASRTPFKGS